MNNLPLYTTECILPEELDIELGILSKFPDDEFSNYAEKVRKYLLNLYEERNFPMGTVGKSLSNIIFDLRKFNEYNVDKVLCSDIYGNNNVFQAFNKWSSVINHWFPEMYDTIISTSKTSVIEQLRHTDTFHKNLSFLIKKDRFSYVKKYPLEKLSRYITPGFRAINGNQPVSNFPASVAKWIYLFTLNKKQFKYKDDIYILDVCMGWGGRMLGLLSACNSGLLDGKRVHLFGTDVNTKVHDRFSMFLSFWKENINPNLNFELYKSMLPAENLLEDDIFREHLGKFDIMLTSPPYFNREQYSGDAGQSYIKYEEYPLWRDGFLYNTLNNTYQLLSDGGYMYWNIADIKANSKYIELENNSVDISKSLGFRYIREYKMLMSSMVGLSRKGGDKVLGKNRVEVGERVYKYEPIFVFRK